MDEAMIVHTPDRATGASEGVIVQPRLVDAGVAADYVAARYALPHFKRGKAPHTLRRHAADLALFRTYITQVGVDVGDLFDDVDAWRELGIGSGFVEWMLRQGYAVGSVNVRLSTVKVYAKQATKAGVLAPDTYTLIKTVEGLSGVAGRNIDEERPQTRRSTKKVEPLPISRERALSLKRQQPSSPQGRRDALLMCLLLDHGLRESEVAALRVEHLNLAARTLRFYRRKVHKT